MSTAMKANNPSSAQFRPLTDKNMTKTPDNFTEQQYYSLNMDDIPQEKIYSAM